MAASKSYDNPLISHARMRSLYRALAEVRTFEERRSMQAKSSRALRQNREVNSPLTSTRGNEACLVGTAIGLDAGDLTSDESRTALLAHIHAAGLRVGDRGIRAREMLKLFQPAVDVFVGSAADRMLCAVGGAMALKRNGGKSAMMAYVGQHDVSPADWRRILQLVAAEPLPLVIVALPHASARDLSALVQRTAGATIPVIPVDAADVIALYRVAQESLIRARAGGGAVMIEGVASDVDPIELLETQLRAKKICTARWFAGVKLDLGRTLTQSRH